MYYMYRTMSTFIIPLNLFLCVCFFCLINISWNCNVQNATNFSYLLNNSNAKYSDVNKLKDPQNHDIFILNHSFRCMLMPFFFQSQLRNICYITSRAQIFVKYSLLLSDSFLYLLTIYLKLLSFSRYILQKNSVVLFSVVLCDLDNYC